MIDIHCHILPGVDDGAFDGEETLRMAEIAVESGVTDIIATPHRNLPYEPREPELQPVFDKTVAALHSFHIPLTLHLGMEIYGLPNVPERLYRGELSTLAGSRYPLIEFPFSDYGNEATELLDKVIAMGYRPIVAHPERYRYVQRYPELLNLWVDMGCLLQINRGSLQGRFGHRAEAISIEMVERGFVAVVATDAHRSDMRTPWLRDVDSLLRREFGDTAAAQLLSDTPHCILQDREIKMEEPNWF